MKLKFDKYWGDADKMNNLIFLASVFDPREKLEYLAFSLSQMYGTDTGGSLVEYVKTNLYELFADYAFVYGQTEIGPSGSQSYDLGQSASVPSSTASLKPMSILKARFKQHKMESGQGGRILEIRKSKDMGENGTT